MDRIFSLGPFHHLFLTALVHPLSTCAHHLFLSHCNNYILPSDSRQPKLAACFILSSGWSFPSRFYSFAPTRSLLYVFRLVHSSPFLLFCSNLLPSLCLPLGAFLPIFTLLLQHVCFSMSSGWSFLSRCATFTPICFLLYVFRLEQSFPFLLFCSNTLASLCLTLGVFLPVFTFLLQHASFSMSSAWCFPSRCATFAPIRFLLYVFRLELSFPLRHFYSKPLPSLCLTLGAFLPVAPLLLQTACNRMHVLGGLSRKNRPALCGVARGC